jgi:hypothetical protein
MDFDRICQARTAMSIRCLPMEDHRGADVVVVVAKMGYRVSPRGVVTIASAPVRISALNGGPRGSLTVPSDWVSEKPGTDILMKAVAYPPRDREVTEMDVSLRVGLIDKALRVYGPRVHYQGAIGVVPGPAGRFGAPLPIVYENAFGGVDTTDHKRWGAEARNTLGVGFALDRPRLVGTPAHTIEDLSAPLAARATTPGSFAPISADWEPRVRYAGTYDERWKRERAPVFPVDFDTRHNACASPGLWSSAPLKGDEPVEVLGCTPDGAPWRFRLPIYEPSFTCVIRGEEQELPTHLDTFFIDAEERKVELTWRAVVKLPRKSELVERIEVNAAPNLPDSVFEGPRDDAEARAGQEASP